ncbi:hypothetical protein BDR04DRAFT_1139697 [Suillus decipiens]|nr:hypothetical protein BDR04DRAFT_1139697 [Suillus decipiens]
MIGFSLSFSWLGISCELRRALMPCSAFNHHLFTWLQYLPCMTVAFGAKTASVEDGMCDAGVINSCTDNDNTIRESFRRITGERYITLRSKRRG